MANKDELEDITLETFKTWGLEEKGSSNGILISISKKLRKLRIDTGSGSEQILSDYDAKKIIENLSPLIQRW